MDELELEIEQPDGENMAQPSDETDSELSPDEAAASLAFATKLSEGMMPQAMPEEEMSEETAEQPEEMTPEVEIEEPVEEPENNDFDEKLDIRLREIEERQRKELEGLKIDLAGEKIKQEYEGKLQTLEKKHKEELESFKREVKSILNA